jgi:hypothetical protein
VLAFTPEACINRSPARTGEAGWPIGARAPMGPGSWICMWATETAGSGRGENPETYVVHRVHQQRQADRQRLGAIRGVPDASTRYRCCEEGHEKRAE